MIVLAIVAVLLALAVPNLSDFFMNNRLESARNELMAGLSLAREEAIRRGVRVGIQHGAPNVQPPAGVWEQGWFIFLDANNNLAWDAGETVVRNFNSVPASVSIRATTPGGGASLIWGGGRPNGLVFSPSGESLSSVVNFIICYASSATTYALSRGGRTSSRGVAVNRVGRIRPAQNPTSGIAQGDTTTGVSADAPNCYPQ